MMRCSLGRRPQSRLPSSSLELPDDPSTSTCLLPSPRLIFMPPSLPSLSPQRMSQLKNAVLLYLLWTRVILASYRHVRARGLVRPHSGLLPSTSAASC
jgi:hypothetical protein